MKNTIKSVAIIAIVAVIGFSMAACPAPSGGPSSPDSNNSKASEPLTFTTKAATGEDVEIIFSKTEILGKAAAPANGDYYVIKVNGVVISSGKVTVSGDTLTFKSDKGQTFEASLSGGTLIVPSIPKDDGGTVVGVNASPEGSSTPPLKEFTVTAADFGSKFREIRGTPGEYILNVTGRITNFSGVTLDNPGVKITVKGTGTSEIDGNGDNIFWVNGGYLVLENITLNRMIGVGKNGIIEMKSGTLDCSDKGSDGVWVSGGAFLMKGGTIQNCKNAVGTGDKGSAIAITGGTITNNSTCGVYMGGERPTLIMTGGTITNCVIGVRPMADGATITITDGKIDNNRDGVWTTSNGTTLTITEGEIKGNQIGVRIAGERNTVTIAGGAITNNNVGGVEIRGRGHTVTIAGGEIKDNDSIGVLIVGEGNTVNTVNTVTMTGGAITNNQEGMTIAGDRTTVTIAGGEIKDNDFTGVSLSYGTENFLTMTGGTISGNNTGLDITNSPNSSFKKTGGIIYGTNAGGNSNRSWAIIIAGLNAYPILLELYDDAMDNAAGNYAATINSTGDGIASKSENW